MSSNTKKPKTKRPAAKRKPSPRKRPEIFDFCEDIYEPDGNPAKFTPKEKLFVLAYLTESGFEAAKAAKIAGYQASSQNAFRVIGCVLMKKHRIKTAINNGFEALTMPKFESLYRVAEIAASTIDDVIGETGGFDPDKARENGSIHNIFSIEITERILAVESEVIDKPDDWNLPEDERPPKETLEKTVTERKYKVKMYSKLGALKILTDVNFAKKHELTGANGADLPSAPAAVLILPDNKRGDSPQQLIERAAKAAKTKKPR